MLLAQNFLPMVVLTFRSIPYMTVPLHKINLNFESNLLQATEDNRFFRKSVLTFLFICIQLIQWIHAWGTEPVQILLESFTYSVGCANDFLIAVEHYRLRHEIASLFNSLLQFERRHNRNNLQDTSQ